MVIPAINCMDAQGVRDKLRIAERLFPFGGGWIHLDVADGKFTFNKTWNDPDHWREFQTPLHLEVHLMVEQPENVIEAWLKVGTKRVIIHLETMEDEEFIASVVAHYNVEAMLAVAPETPVESLRLYFEKFTRFQILAVTPGLAGQKFLPSALDKIRFLREYFPRATIEVDGGINLETGKKVREAGAHILVAASYIFESENPARAYATLASLT